MNRHKILRLISLIILLGGVFIDFYTIYNSNLSMLDLQQERVVVEFSIPSGDLENGITWKADGQETRKESVSYSTGESLLDEFAYLQTFRKISRDYCFLKITRLLPVGIFVLYHRILV